VRPEWQFTIAVVPTEEMLQLDMYRFLIWPIREQDQHNGNLFLKRYLLGPQAMWRQAQATIFALKNLWNTTKIPDGLLQYLKNIVGWTGELDYITDGLDALALRRLINASVPLWKNRGTEDTLINVLRLLTSARARYYNWFDLRWIIGETELGEQRQDYDPWLLGEIGGSEFDEYYTNLRIVDDGLDRLLVRNIINLMRPTGERYEVVYLKFLDQFNIAQDTSQWAYNGTPSQLIVGEDALKMIDDTKEERAIAAVVGATDWADYMATALVVGHSDLAGYGFGLIFDAIDQLNFYAAILDPLNNQLVLRRRIAGVDGTIATYDFGTVGEELFNDIRYTIRVQSVVEGSATRIQVYVDGVERINITDVTYNHGAMGLIHDMDATLTCEEAELFHLPVDSEIIDINP
jgi:phage tail-like protein